MISASSDEFPGGCGGAGGGGGRPPSASSSSFGFPSRSGSPVRRADSPGPPPPSPGPSPRGGGGGAMPVLLAEEADIPAQNCFRLVLLGSARVGKTSIVSRFLNNAFDDGYTPTIEDFHRKVYKIRGEVYRLDILDTSGTDPFPAMKRLSLVTGDLFLIVYAIDSRQSFEEAGRLQQQVFQAKLGQSSSSSVSSPSTLGVHSRARIKQFVPMVIVGNKTDRDADRVVDTSELRLLTDAFPGSCDGVETSAKRNINIEEVFLKLFYLAKLPVEMSPSQHRRIQPGSSFVSLHSPQTSRRLMSLRRRLSDAYGVVAMNARRPSIRTDLLTLQTRQNKQADGGGGDLDFARRDLAKCIVQ